MPNFNAPLTLIQATYETSRVGRPLAQKIVDKIHEILRLRDEKRGLQEETERNISEDPRLAEAIVDKAEGAVDKAKTELLELLQEDQKSLGATEGAPVIEHSGVIYLRCHHLDPEAQKGLNVKARKIVSVARYFGTAMRGRKGVGLECDRIVYEDEWRGSTMRYSMILGDTSRYALDREGVLRLLQTYWESEISSKQTYINHLQAQIAELEEHARNALAAQEEARSHLDHARLEAEADTLLGVV